jgi:hypothetical protein
LKRLANWAVGAVFSIVAVLGLSLAASAHDAGFELFGFVMSIFGVFMLFRLIALSIPTIKEDA